MRKKKRKLLPSFCRKNRYRVYSGDAVRIVIYYEYVLRDNQYRQETLMTHIGEADGNNAILRQAAEIVGDELHAEHGDMLKGFLISEVFVTNITRGFSYSLQWTSKVTDTVAPPYLNYSNISYYDRIMLTSRDVFIKKFLANFQDCKTQTNGRLGFPTSGGNYVTYEDFKPTCAAVGLIYDMQDPATRDKIIGIESIGPSEEDPSIILHNWLYESK